MVIYAKISSNVEPQRASRGTQKKKKMMKKKKKMMMMMMGVFLEAFIGDSVCSISEWLLPSDVQKKKNRGKKKKRKKKKKKKQN